tara:strand:+ start:25972 stop:26691 length:720 start_codon:yes stop_codon:yes gene_type:complete
MGSALFFGFLLGLRHALDADHLAAVATLASGNQKPKEALKMGFAWGGGHALTLCAVGIIVMSFDTFLPTNISYLLQFLVGLMLVWLGIDVILRLKKARIHFHSHRHSDGTVHFHAHSHGIQTPHKNIDHNHQHLRRPTLRAFLVGLMHGMAGSAALLIFAIDNFESIWTGLVYIGLFGLGAMTGMALLTVVIAVPLRSLMKRLSWGYNYMIFTLGIISVGIGFWVLSEASSATFNWLFA